VDTGDGKRGDKTVGPWRGNIEASGVRPGRGKKKAENFIGRPKPRRKAEGEEGKTVGTGTETRGGVEKKKKKKEGLHQPG